MEDYGVFQTEWEELDEMTRTNLAVTGYAAFEHITGETNLEDQEGIVTYANVPIDGYEDLETHLYEHEITIPQPGTQELYVIVADYPASHKIKDAQIAEPDTLLSDMITADPRKFRKKVKHDKNMRNFIENNLSHRKKQEMIEKYSTDDYISQEITEILNDCELPR